jgi:hypothetical protein
MKILDSYSLSPALPHRAGFDRPGEQRYTNTNEVLPRNLNEQQNSSFIAAKTKQQPQFTFL